jgi:acetyl esterase/lipase
MHPKAAISPEAQAFLDACDPIPNTPLAEIDIPRLRETTAAAYAPQIDMALARYPVTTQDAVINDTPCQIVTPINADPTRQILYLFGGGFIQGSPTEDLPITAALAQKAGATVIVPNYPLAPEHPFPKALDTVTSLAKHILKSNPNALLVGESAGGNLILAITHRLREMGMASNAIALLSPACDLAFTGDSGAADRDPVLPAHRIDQVLAAYLQGADPHHPDASPINGLIDAKFPPTFITTGTRDLFQSNCIRLSHMLRTAGASVDLHIWEGMWHVFEFYPQIPEADASLSEIAAFLDAHF